MAPMFRKASGRNRGFARDKSGNISLLFALTLMPMVVFGGMAIDYSRALGVRDRVQDAADAAALSAASAVHLTEEERIELGKKVFAANYPEGAIGQPAVPVITFDEDKVTLTIGATVQTTLMGLAGIEEVAVGTVSEVMLPKAGKADVVLVLDYSGSMGWRGKYEAMRDAAIELVNDLSDNGANEDIKFGIVPYSTSVYAKMKKKYWAGMGNSSAKKKRCAFRYDEDADDDDVGNDRRAPHNVSGDTPDLGDDNTKWSPIKAGSSKDEDKFDDTCQRMKSHHLLVKPLTKTHDDVVAKLNQMTPSGWTHTQLGLEFGWHVLSSNAPYTQGVPYGEEDYVKAIILLTDGVQTRVGNGPGGAASIWQAQQNTETICTAIKANDVILITVAFDLSSGYGQKEILENCASKPDYFFDADTNTDLHAAFKKITARLGEAIYISK